MTDSTVTAVSRSRWRSLGDRTTVTLELVASAIIIFMMLLILASVTMRLAFGEPIQGTNELVGYIWLPACVFLGFVVAVVRGQTIEADIIYAKLPVQLRREVRLFTSFVATIACVGFGWYSLEEALHALKIGKMAPASDVYIAPVFALVPWAFAVMAMLFAVDAVRAIRGKFDDERVGTEALEDTAKAEGDLS
jgi:TRAP-type transport system small permease protein